MNLDLNKVASLDHDGFKQILFFVCERGDTEQLNKMLLKDDIMSRLDSEMFSLGLFASVLQAKSETAQLLLDIKDKIYVKNEDLQKVFNVLVKRGDRDTIELLDESFNFLKPQFSKKGKLELIDGKISRLTSNMLDAKSISPIEQKEREYSGSLIDASLDSGQLNFVLSLIREPISKQTMIEMQFDKDVNNSKFLINSTLVEDLFVKSCDSQNIEAINILLKNNYTKDIVKYSAFIKEYLDEPTQNLTIKEKVRESINFGNLVEQAEEERSLKKHMDYVINRLDRDDINFLNMCKNGSASQIKRLPQEPRVELLLTGLFTALVYEKQSATKVLLDLICKSDEFIFIEDFNPIVNLLTSRGDSAMVQYIDAKFDFYSHALKCRGDFEPYIIRPITALGGPERIPEFSQLWEISKDYDYNVLTFNLNDADAIKEIISKPTQINQSLLEESYLLACKHNYVDTAGVFLTHLKTAYLVRSSEYVAKIFEENPKMFEINTRYLSSKFLNEKLESDLVIAEKVNPKHKI